MPEKFKISYSYDLLGKFAIVEHLRSDRSVLSRFESPRFSTWQQVIDWESDTLFDDWVDISNRPQPREITITRRGGRGGNES